MKIFILTVFALSSYVSHASGSESAIYGWDVKCVGKSGLELRASQSDDDFYMDVQSASIPKKTFWMSTERFDSRIKNLLFVTDPKLSDGNQASLSVARSNANRFGYGTGELVLEGERYDLNCFIRYGKDEEEFGKISAENFPTIAVPTVQFQN